MLRTFDEKASISYEERRKTYGMDLGAELEKSLARLLQGHFPSGVGFLLYYAAAGEEGSVISNMTPESMRAILASLVLDVTLEAKAS